MLMVLRLCRRTQFSIIRSRYDCRFPNSTITILLNLTRITVGSVRTHDIRPRKRHIAVMLMLGCPRPGRKNMPCLLRSFALPLMFIAIAWAPPALAQSIAADFEQEIR